MSILEAILMGIVQGIFMFIPVSSTSHLVLTQHFLIERGSSLPPPSSPELILFDLVLHVGTLVSIAIIFRKSLFVALRGLWQDIRTSTNWKLLKQKPYVRLSILSLISLLITGAIGLIITAFGTSIFDRPSIIALNLIITGLLLWWTDSVKNNRLGPKDLTARVAILIGAAQGFALLPGLSRSGLTIAIALYLGLRRPWAATYSFFLAIPTILTASALQLILVLREDQPVLVEPWAFLAGFVVAAVVGTGALAAVLWILYRARFRIFSLYVWLFAILVLTGVI